MKKLPRDIIVRIEHDFRDCAGEVIILLQSLKGIELERSRIVRCILYLAGDSYSALSALAEHASDDYRDILFWAEYADHSAERPKRVKDFSRRISRTDRPPAPAAEFVDHLVNVRQRKSGEKSNT